jgi:hypothetical protein
MTTSLPPFWKHNADGSTLLVNANGLFSSGFTDDPNGKRLARERPTRRKRLPDYESTPLNNSSSPHPNIPDISGARLDEIDLDAFRALQSRENNRVAYLAQTHSSSQSLLLALIEGTEIGIAEKVKELSTKVEDFNKTNFGLSERLPHGYVRGLLRKENICALLQFTFICRGVPPFGSCDKEIYVTDDNVDNFGICATCLAKKTRTSGSNNK